MYLHYTGLLRSYFRHTGPSARSPQATKTNELLKELLTAKVIFESVQSPLVFIYMYLC